MRYQIGQVAGRLGISPTSVRRWSERFSLWLDDEAGNPELLENGRRAARLYSENDIEVLARVLEVKEQGLSEEEIEADLAGDFATPVPWVPPSGDLPIQRLDEVGTSLNSEDVATLELLLRKLIDVPEATPHLRQAQRDLLHVVLQNATTLMNDALMLKEAAKSLKDENDRLRRRLHVLEEEMGRLKESDWNHRLILEERVRRLEEETVRNNRSWWDKLWGRE
jgi:DNA-binding transcriptional MerR regulator